MGAGLAQEASADVLKSPTDALVVQLEACVRDLEVATFCTVLLKSDHVVKEELADAGRRYAHELEKQGRSQHTLGSPHIHIFMAMLAGIEVAGRERCGRSTSHLPAPLHFPFCAASPRFFGPVFFRLPFCLRDALVLSWVGSQSEFLTSCSTWSPCLRRRIPHRGRHGRVKLCTDVLNVAYHYKTT